MKSQHEGNKLFEVRGNAGTHDLGLGRCANLQMTHRSEIIHKVQTSSDMPWLPCSATLRALRSSTQTDGSSFGIPRYDKSAYAGRGDRADADTWPQASAPAQLCGEIAHSVCVQAAVMCDSFLMRNVCIRRCKGGWTLCCSRVGC